MSLDPIFVVCSGMRHFQQSLEDKGFHVLNLGNSYDANRKFPNTDIYTRIEGLDKLPYKLETRRVIVLQSGTFGRSVTGEIWTTADRLFEVLQILSVLNQLYQIKEIQHKQFEETPLPSPANVQVFFSLYPCSLQDKAFKTGESNSSKLIYDLLITALKKWANRGTPQVGTLDLHAPPDLPWVKSARETGKLWLASVSDRLVEKCKELFQLDTPIVLGPDEGAQARLGLPGFKKYRTDSFSVVIDGKIPVKGKDVIILDDLTKSGSTLIKTREVLLKQGAKKVVCAVTHVTPTFKEEESLLARLFDKVDGQLVVSDSVYTDYFLKQHTDHVVSILPEILSFANY